MRGDSILKSGGRAGTEPVAMMQFLNFLRRAVGQLDRVRICKHAAGPNQLNFAALAQLDQILAERIEDFDGLPAERGDIDLGRSKLNAPGACILGLVQKFGDMQERLRGNAAHMKAGAAGPLAGIDHGDLQALVGSQEGGGIAAGAAAQDDKLGFCSIWHEC